MKQETRGPMRIVGFGLALILVSGTLPGCGKKGDASTSEAARQQAAAAVLVNPADVVLAERRTLESGATLTGELKPQSVTEVTARFEGDLKAVLVREGERVRAGQSLAVYKPSDVQDAWTAAEAELLAAKSTLLAAQNGEARARRLLDAGAVSPSELESAEAARAAAEARVRAAEAAVNHTKENAEKLEVPSPVDGWVSKVTVHNGDRTAVGDPMLTVVNTEMLELSATIPSEALSRARIGTPIRFQVDAFPGEEFEGKIDRINPTTDPGTRQVRIYARIPNPEARLVGGLFASGRVIESRKDEALAAPLSALRTEAGARVVYKLSGGRAARVAVQTGLQDDATGMVELIGPLQQGDSLLTGVLPGIRDGAPVRLIAQSGGTPGPQK